MQKISFLQSQSDGRQHHCHGGNIRPHPHRNRIQSRGRDVQSLGCHCLGTLLHQTIRPQVRCRPQEKLHGDIIGKDATTSEVHKAEANHTAKRTNCALYEATHKRCVQFIVGVVSKTWYRYLNSPTIFYTAVTAL